MALFVVTVVPFPLKSTVWSWVFAEFFFFFPQNVIDGDLCEQFNMVDPGKQRSIAEDLDKTPNELSKRLEDIRTRYAF